MNELYGIVSLGGTVIGGSLYQRGLKGETGNGIASVVMESNYDLTITYTDESVVTVPTGLDTYKALLEGYKSDTYSYMLGAINSASSASTSASSALTAATEAATYRGEASNHATRAQTSATSASSSATAASTAKTAAETAQGLAETAKTDAETAAANAATSETNAATSATNASNSAGQAGTSAANASTSASEASTNALRSEGYAVGEQNATPVGSDSPYYENNAKYYAEAASDSADAAAQSASDAAASASVFVVDDELDGTSTNPVQNKVIKKALDDLPDIEQLLPTESASGSFVSFPDGQSMFPMKSLKVSLEPIQDLSHGDPSPSNICPIYGHDSVGAVRAGKNILPLPTLQGYWAIANGSFVSDAQWVACQKIKVNPNTQYHLSSTFVTRWCGVCAYDANGSYLGGIGEAAQSADHAIDLTITTPSNCAYIGVCMANPSSGSQKIRPYDVTDLQLELGSTATDYEPYEGHTYTADLGQTVYGGTVDLVSGELVIDRAMVLIKNLTWVRNTTSYPETPYFYTTISGGIGGSAKQPLLLSSAYETGSNLYERADGIITNANYHVTNVLEINVFDSQHASVSLANFLKEMGDEQIVYPLATPQTIQLTPQIISTLYGRNNVWSEQGDVDVTYKADIQLYIDKKTNELAVAIAAL